MPIDDHEFCKTLSKDLTFFKHDRIENDKALLK